jgi:hypothetical protein
VTASALTGARAICRAVALAWPLAAVLAGCGVLPGTGPDLDALHAQARAALDRWAAAKASSGADIGIVGERTGQVGDWEGPVGENNKLALMAGRVRVTAELPADTPSEGTVTWADGTTTAVPVLSATDAVAALVAGAMGSPCDECRALEITSARLVAGPVETIRGAATAPIWEFTLAGTRVIVTQVAIADPVVVEPPAWNPDHPPVGLAIDAATGRPEDASLTVSFVGAPKPGSEPCGSDYTTEAVESDLAIVVIVVEHPHGFGESCTAVGAIRTATVTLAKPLGLRAVLEVQSGQPVTIRAP